MEKRTRFPVRRFFLGLLAVLVPGVTALSALQVYFERQINRKDEYLAPILIPTCRGPRSSCSATPTPTTPLRARAFRPVCTPSPTARTASRRTTSRPGDCSAKTPGSRYLVVQCDPHVVARYRLSSNNRFRTYYFADHRDINRLYGARLSPFKQRLFTAAPIVDTDNRAEAVEVLIAHAGTLLRRRPAPSPAARRPAGLR